VDNGKTGCMMQVRTLTGHCQALRKPENDNQSMIATLRNKHVLRIYTPIKA
jgi:hypothetical protein